MLKIHLNKNHFKILLSLILAFSILSLVGLVLVKAAGGDTGLEVCNVAPPEDPVKYEEWKKLCVPPQLVDIQALVVRLIYVAWAASFPLFVFIIMFIGFSYMRADDPKAQGDLRMKLLYSIIGFIILLASQPIAAAAMTFFLSGSVSSCYANLDTPGFTFFFEDVCTGVRGVECADDQVEFNRKCDSICSVIQPNGLPQSRVDITIGNNTYVLNCFCTSKTCASVRLKT